MYQSQRQRKASAFILSLPRSTQTSEFRQCTSTGHSDIFLVQRLYSGIKVSFSIQIGHSDTDIKKGDSEHQNYRPTSLTSVLAKLPEKKSRQSKR